MFSTAVWEHFRNPQHRGRLEEFSGEGWAGSRRLGQFMRIQVKLVNHRIESARFETIGCVAAIAACDCLLQWATSKSLDEVAGMRPIALEQELGGLPPGRRYCAEMAVHALGKAIESCDGSLKGDA